MRGFLPAAVLGSLLVCSCTRDVMPEMGPVTPASGHGRSQAFRIEASYPDDAGSIRSVGLFVGGSLADIVHGCWVNILPPANMVALRTNDDREWQPAIAVGKPGAIANDKCSIDAAQVKIERAGEQLHVTVPLVFNDALKGPVKIWAIAYGPTKHSGWQERGAWAAE